MNDIKTGQIYTIDNYICIIANSRSLLNGSHSIIALRSLSRNCGAIKAHDDDFAILNKEIYTLIGHLGDFI